MISYRKRMLTLCLALTAALAFGLWMHQLLAREMAAWQVQRAGLPSTSLSEGATSNAILRDPVTRSHRQAGVLVFIWTSLLQCFITYLWLSGAWKDQQSNLRKIQDEATHQLQDLVRTRDAVVFGLAKLADSRDPETGEHLERISLYSTRLAAEVQRDPRFRHRVDKAFVHSIGLSSALHDIGKVGVRDDILRKPARLNADERRNMETHCQIGGECIEQIERRLGPSNFLAMAREIALYHHERWDGSGYPHGLAGGDIPLAARIVALADVYDALSSRRVYKAPLPHEQCVQAIRESAASHFDPHLVEIFLRIEGSFREIAAQYGQVEALETTVACPDETCSELPVTRYPTRNRETGYETFCPDLATASTRAG